MHTYVYVYGTIIRLRIIHAEDCDSFAVYPKDREEMKV